MAVAVATVLVLWTAPWGSPSPQDTAAPATGDPSAPATGDPSAPATGDPSAPATGDPSAPATGDRTSGSSGFVRAWSAPRPTEDGGRPPRFPVALVAGNAVAVGDRVLSLADGAVVLGPSGRAVDARARSSPDGMVATLRDQTTLELTDAASGVLRESLPVVGDGPARGRPGGQRSEVVGWVDETVVVRTWDDGLGSSTSWAIDTRSGEVRWRTFADAYAPVGGRWFLGLAAVGLVLVDGSAGTTHPVPVGVAERLIGEPVVVDDIAYGSTTEGVVEWDAVDGVVTGRGTGTVSPDVVPSDAQRRVAWVDLAGGRTVEPTFPGIGVLDGAVVTAGRDEIRGARSDGTSWSLPLPGLRGMTVVPRAGVVVAVVAANGRGPVATGTGSGWAVAVVVDAEGRQLRTVRVRPVRSAPTDITAVVGGDVVVDDPVAPGGLRIIALADGREVPATEALQTWAGTADVTGARVLGPVTDAVAAVGARDAPWLWRADDRTLLGAHGVVPLDAVDVPTGARPVVADAAVAVPTTTGSILFTDPRRVDLPTRLAVGVQRPSSHTASDRAPRAVAGLTPLAAVGDLLLAGPVGRGGGAARVPLRALDPLTGDLRWASTVTTGPAWPLASGSHDAGGELRAARPPGDALLGPGTPLVVVDGDRITAVGPDDGRRRWTYGLGDRTITDAVLVGDAVVLARGTGLIVLDAATGTRERFLDIGEVVTTLTGDGSDVLVGTAGGRVEVVDPVATRRPRETLAVGDAPVDDVAVVEGRIVVLLGDRSVHSYMPPSPVQEDPDRVELP